MDNTAIVVLGMHASGTSLVAHILIELGVNMGKRFTGPVKKMPTWENVDFMKINAMLLKQSGGNWNKIPSSEKLEQEVVKHTEQMKEAVATNQDAPLWGFKDPRTSITVARWHPLLDNPKYIYVHRSHDSVAKSILQRGPCKQTHDYWAKLARKYNESIKAFIQQNEPEYIEVSFERLVSLNYSMEETTRIASFIGTEDQKLIEKAHKVIRRR